MKQRRFNGGASLRTLKNVKRALKKAQQERETEKKKAILCALQRDFYDEALKYLEEYVLFIPRSAELYERYNNGVNGYRLFAARKGSEYAEGARPFVAELYGRENDAQNWDCYTPYPCALRGVRKSTAAR